MRKAFALICCFAVMLMSAVMVFAQEATEEAGDDSMMATEEAGMGDMVMATGDMSFDISVGMDGTMSMAEADATEDVTTEDRSMSTEETMTEMATMTHVRIAHLSPDAGPVDLWINGEPTDLLGLAYPSITEFMSFEAGVYNVALVPGGADLSHDDVLGPFDLTVGEGQWYTVAAVGSIPGATATAQVIEEDFSPMSSGVARITFFHAIEDAPAIDVLRNDVPFVISLGYPGAMDEANDGYFAIGMDAGTYDFSVSVAGDPSTVLFTLPDVEIEENHSYLIVAAGTTDETDDADAMILIEVTHLEDLGMTPGMMGDGGAEATEEA